LKYDERKDKRKRKCLKIWYRYKPVKEKSKGVTFNTFCPEPLSKTTKMKEIGSSFQHIVQSEPVGITFKKKRLHRKFQVYEKRLIFEGGILGEKVDYSKSMVSVETFV